MVKKIHLFLVLVFVCVIQCDEDDGDDVFVPTAEWQVVRKGQKIPRGLHVRMNLETGITEAKLLDPSESPEDKTKALQPIPQDPEDPIPPKKYKKSDLSESLKNIKSDDILNPDEIKKIKDEFRSYDEIKKSLSELNITPKLDSEVIADLLKRHKEVTAEEKLDQKELLRIIEDLDFLAHQYDNAKDFVNQNGFHDVIYKNVNSSSAEIKKETLRLMGSLMQNNIAPKIHALETGAIGVLVRLINFDGDSEVKSRALTALGALVRSFPAAQLKFIENGGLSVLTKFFETDDIKIQIKLITMISDLIIEHNWAVLDDKMSKYYTPFDLVNHVLEHNWCDNLNKLMFRLIVTDQDDHDSIEKCLTAMHSLRGSCGAKFKKNLLTRLQKRYESLASNDEDQDEAFFRVLKDLCDEILYYVYKNSIKTEL